MRLEEFSCHIQDELRGACDYARRSIELKPMNKDWANTLMKMSQAELSHAENLYDMVTKYYKKLEESYMTVPENLEHCFDDIMSMFSKGVSEVKRLHEYYEG